MTLQWHYKVSGRRYSQVAEWKAFTWKPNLGLPNYQNVMLKLKLQEISSSRPPDKGNSTVDLKSFEYLNKTCQLLSS